LKLGCHATVTAVVVVLVVVSYNLTKQTPPNQKISYKSLITKSK